MKILFISNYYPPSNYGWGYMQLCEEVADGLAARGHRIVVLTSIQRDGPEIVRPYRVHRLLTIEPDWRSAHSAAWQFFIGRRRREREAVAHLDRLAAEFRPDVVFVWHAVGLPRVLLQTAESLKAAVTVYYLADYLPELPDEYLAYWQQTSIHPVANVLKKPVSHVALRWLQREGKPLALRYAHCICVSAYVRERLVSQGLIPAEAIVIHNGVDLDAFSTAERRKSRFSEGEISCIVAGRIIREKGIHTVVEAFARLHKPRISNVSLTILGSGEVGYLALLKAQIANNQLDGSVHFRDTVPREQMPRILAQHDILLLPSEYAEPIARSMQEAMAVGLLVIGTTTGGSGELLVHERTGLAFAAGNVQSLARQLERAVSDPSLANRLAAAGQLRVRESFDIDQTISKVDAYLQSLVEQRR